MRNFFQKKVWIVLLAVLALGSLTVLAVSLDDVSFREAQRYRHDPVEVKPPPPTDGANPTWESVPLWKYVVLLGLFVLLIILVGLLLSPERRKRFFRMVLRVAITVAAIYYLFINYGDKIFAFQNAAGGGEDPALADAPPMPVFQPPHVPAALSYLVSFLCALAWVAIMWGLYLGWKKYTALNAKRPLGEIARIARSSLDDLSSGRDSSDVIVNCYLRMSDVVADKRKLHREIAMTPQEFALRLERAGLPGEAVRRLTGLFEMVRYGDRKSAPRDVTEAVSCLNAILRSCGETP